MNNTSIVILASLTFVAASTPAAEAQGDPCALLTTAEVQQAFAGAKPGQLDRKLEKDGILRCVWDYSGGHLLLVAGTGTEVTDPPKEEAKSWTVTFVDPLRGDAERRVRYELLPGVGDEAVAVVEPRDAAKGFTRDGTILVVRRGKRQVAAMSATLARPDRAEALKVLTELGKAIAKRLD